MRGFVCVRRSAALVGVAHVRDLEVLGSSLCEDGLVGEAGKSRLKILLLAHLEVFAEVLVTAPPVEVDHADSLVTAHLMEVGVPDVVLDSVGGESAITIELAVSLVSLTDSVAPVLDELLLLVLDHHVEEEAAPEVEDDEAPHDTNAVLGEERVHLPVNVTERVLHKASNVLESSPSLCLIAGLLGAIDELAEVAISVLGQRSKLSNSSIRDLTRFIHGIISSI